MALQADLKIVDRDDEGVDRAFRADVLKGLAQRQKAIPARWFYDTRGSELFEQITQLPEYYPTRTEISLLKAHARDMARMAGPGRVVVEFGAGSLAKTPILLREIDAAAYVPIDISGPFLREASADLSREFPDLPVLPVEANFMNPVRLPSSLHGRPMLGFFPGSTIGNMVPGTAVDLLRSMRATLGDGAQLLIGFDRVKPAERLVAAYDDAQGVTAAFNLNLLERINRELDADIPVDRFTHVACWNPDWNRVEMHLKAVADVDFSVSGERFSMREGETIHSENSHKYRPEQAALLLRAAGWDPAERWTDAAGDFLIILANASEPRSAP